MLQEVSTDLPYKTLKDGFSESAEILGKNLEAFQYKVPPLDFTDEDISLEFVLSTFTGPLPSMAVGFCDDKLDPINCLSDLYREIVLDPTNDKFVIA